MSVVVAVKKKGRVVIAADSLVCSGPLTIPANHIASGGKICTVGKSLFGIVGDAATRNVLESIATKYKGLLRLSSAAEIFETFRRLHPILTEKYHVHEHADAEDSFASSQIHALIVNSHGIFSLDGDRTVIELDRFWAIGCGATIALGAMHALYGQSDDPEAIARAGINSACEFESCCALPLECRVVKLQTRRRHSELTIRS